MNYIGSKTKLTGFIWNSITEFTKGEVGQFCDLFAGTGTIGLKFKKEGYPVIANDIQTYSYFYNQYLLGCDSNNTNFRKLIESKNLNDLEGVFRYINTIQEIEGFLYSNYCPNGTENSQYRRTYFTDKNGKKCDGIRVELENLIKEGLINKHEYYYLNSCLLEAIDKVANTTSVYAAYLKTYKKSSTNTLNVLPLEVYESGHKNLIFQEDANVLVKNIKPFIYYLDPPYNNRVYSDNYHILETVSKYDNPEIKGKTGIRVDSYRSKYSQKKNAEKSFTELINNLDSTYVFLSYYNEGIIPLEKIREIMEKRGEYRLYQTEYKRYKADNKRKYSSDSTTEYLHCLKIS